MRDPMAVLRAEYLEQASRDFDHYTKNSWIESPIEALAVGGLLVSAFTHPTEDRWSMHRTVYRALGLQPALILVDEGEHVVVGVQAEAKLDGRAVRYDMVAIVDRKAVVVVELDGHDFHERTRAQATRDKKRDRKLALVGWSVARFTGSEVNANPLCVAEHLAEVAQHEADKYFAEWLATHGKELR